jgi:2-keto-4-pentenoate hydratase
MMTMRFAPAVVEGLRAQLASRSRALADGAASVGWKIAADMPGIASDEGANGSVFGYLTTATTKAVGDRVETEPAIELCAEVELAIQLGDDVGYDADLEAARSAVGTLGVALEIVDVDEHADLHTMIESNVFHRLVAFGPPTPPAAIHAASVKAQLAADGRILATRTAAVDPARTVHDMAQLLGRFGQQLRAGDRLIAGSLIHLPVEPEHLFTATIDGLGQASLHVTAGREGSPSQPD